MTAPDAAAPGRPMPPPAAIVLDTAALLAGLGPAASGSGAGPDAPQWLCPPSVHAEIRPGGPTGRALERAEAAGLRVVPPPADALAAVTEAAARTGDLGVLSAADRDVLALTWSQAKRGPAELWSDDYAVLNVARSLGLSARPVTARGGQEARTWHVRCTGCGRYLDTPPEHPCPVCGSPLKRTRRAPAR